MAETIAIDKIRVIIGRKTLELTPPELKELRDILNELFPETVRIVPSTPIVIERPIWPRPRKYWSEVWNDNTSNGRAPQTLCLSAVGGN